MIAATHMKGLRVLVFGLGRSGLAAALSCMAGGAEVFAWDDHESARAEAEKRDIPLVDLRDVDFAGLDGLVLSPGVPLTHPEPHWTVEKAKAADIPIFGDTEIFAKAIKDQTPQAKLVAITGTNGKSTTTALIGHIAGRYMPTQVGGNIGVPVLELELFEGEGVYVIEFSSYQIDLSPSVKPDIAICLNLSPDHLDRHGDMATYAAVKEKLFHLQDEGNYAVVGHDDPFCRAIASRLSRPDVVLISGYETTKNISVLDGRIFEGDNCVGELGLIKSLQGKHNGQNMAASFAACRALGLDEDEIISAIQSFPGLSHRMEYLGSIGTVDFINDSKATNVEAASMALSSFKNIHWIAGGQAKEGSLDPLLEFAPNMTHAYLIGSSSDLFAQTLDGKVEYSLCDRIEKAVHLASQRAAREGNSVVLLSPAAASFDQYKNFEDRGDDFIKHVSSLSGFKAERGAE